MRPGAGCAVGQSLRCTRFQCFAAGGQHPGARRSGDDRCNPVAATPVGGLIAPEDVQDNSGIAPSFTPPVGYAPPPDVIAQDTRGLFESDHAFDGFVKPLSNPIQSKDPRALTEIRFLTMFDWSRPSTPVIGGGTIQVYAPAQFRLALNERFELFIDKFGLVRVSPKGASSIFGLANIMAGAKYVLIRDEENQFLFSGAVQYEAPTGYPKIFEGHGDGLLGVYGIIGKEFWDNWHFVSTFGQNIALDNSNSGYFMTTAHIDRRFGKFIPFYEANWFYYNQSGRNVPSRLRGRRLDQHRSGQGHGHELRHQRRRLQL